MNNIDTKAKKTKNKTDFKWECFSTIELLCFSVVFIMLFFTLFFRLSIVDGSSMEDTLNDKELLLVRSVLYEPKQGDIVIIHDPSLDGQYGNPLVKRVIAVGGQTIDIDFDTWTVTVDGKVIDEPYIKLDPSSRVTSSFTYPLTVPEGEVFVMGDNRNKSGDSRASAVGTIDTDCVVGKAFLRIYPYESFGYLKNPFEQ